MWPRPTTDRHPEYPGGELDLEIVHATEGADGIALGPLLAKTGYTTLDQGFVNTALDQERHHLHRRRRRHPALPRVPDRAARREVDLPRGRLPADLRRAADRRAAGATSPRQIQRHTLLHEDLKRFFDGFPRNAHPMAVLSSAVSALSRVLPGLARPARPRAGRAVDDPAAGQAADHRGVRLQEVDRPAVPLPGQLADARRELPADDVRAARPSPTRSTPSSCGRSTCC